MGEGDSLLEIFGRLVTGLDDARLEGTGIVKTWAPVPYFGDLANSTVATVGLNPSDKEFEDDHGRELKDKARRFYSLDSLNIDSWSELNTQDLISIRESCDNYFSRNPYNRWFGKLGGIISDLNVSFGAGACHLDLVPYATRQKWSSLGRRNQRNLLEANKNMLIGLVRNSKLRIIVLNGKGVIREFESAFGIPLERRSMSSRDLSQKRERVVTGHSYKGMLDGLIGTEDYAHKVLVLGFNHNIQGSFGISKAVVSSIERWVAREGEAYLAGSFIKTPYRLKLPKQLPE